MKVAFAAFIFIFNNLAILDFHSLFFLYIICVPRASGEIGRRAGFRFQSERVRVRVPPGAPIYIPQCSEEVKKPLNLNGLRVFCCLYIILPNFKWY